MKSIIFDLGGVLFARNPQKTTAEFKEFFSFISPAKPMPEYWEEYDRGTRTLEQTIEHMAQIKNLSCSEVEGFIRAGIDMQEPIAPTEALIKELKAQGYKLYVLSNMAKEFIEFLREVPIYSYFDGEVVSCEELTVKPEPKIYQIILDRYNLEPEHTLFIDDRAANLDTAAEFGINTFLFVRAEAQKSCDDIRQMLAPLSSAK